MRAPTTKFSVSHRKTIKIISGKFDDNDTISSLILFWHTQAQNIFSRRDDIFFLK